MPLKLIESRKATAEEQMKGDDCSMNEKGTVLFLMKKGKRLLSL